MGLPLIEEVPPFTQEKNKLAWAEASYELRMTGWRSMSVLALTPPWSDPQVIDRRQKHAIPTGQRVT